VLGPLWSKVSILRYRITGPVDKPQVNEVLRQARGDSHDLTQALNCLNLITLTPEYRPEMRKTRGRGAVAK
jgi:hypothetical protein